MTGKKIGLPQVRETSKEEKIMKEHEIIDVMDFLEEGNADDPVLEFLYHYINPGEFLFR